MDIRPSRQLPTPPEPDTDYLMGGHHNTDLNASSVHVADWDMNVNPHSAMGSPLRRVSTLAYHNTPLRDPRERAGIRHRWLVVVTPPASLVQEHGPLGHTLASGPSQRLSQGILMPLLPTMYGQITAIAREFNFPSPVGLCLYLNIAEQGFSSSPRISDEIWPALWSHLFDARSPGSVQQTPIGGRIEFDIDRRKARWLDSWLTSDRRHAVDVPVSVPLSLTHWRGDSRNSFVDEPADERSDVMPAIQSGVRSRHIPKKLSLVDKLETLSVTSSMANAVAGSGTVHDLSTALATVLQENEPETAKIDLEKRVESWRASSSVAPTPMATTSQNSLENVNTSNTVQLNDLDLLADADGVGELDLDGFAWSISSVGPPDYDPLASPTSTFHVPSVHLDGRLEGSVLLSPSTATSWGPDLSDYSPMLSPFRLPSPDIGQRIVEDCPPTPSTVTSWGPEELLYSPESVVFRLPSPDLGMRVLDDSPCTPFTITSRDFPAAEGDRSEEPDPHALHSNHVFPYFVAEHSSAWPLTWPFCEPQTGASLRSSQQPKQDLTIETYDISGTTNMPAPRSSHVFPYFVPESPAWTLTWPFHRLQALSNSLPITKGSLMVETYDAAYRPVEITSEQIDSSEESAAPNRVSPTVTCLSPTHHDDACDAQPLKVASIHLGTSYPNLRIYPPVYPFLSIYPPPPVDLDMGQEPPLVSKFSSYSGLGSQYPFFDLYPAGYPTNLMYIYPPPAPPSPASLLSVRLPSVYPVIELYSPQYPFVTPYPPCLIPPFGEMHQAVDSDEPNDCQVQSVNLKGDRPSYPAFDIYPAVTDVDSIYSNLPEADGVSVHLPEAYPRITPYPTVYPEFALYPPIIVGTDDVPKTALTYHYPCIRTYPAIYPYFEIYPGHISDGENGTATSEDISQQSLLPRFDAYPEVYPYFNIYNTGSPKEDNKPTPLSVKVFVQYPRFNLYPPIYPYFEIFPGVALDVTESRLSMLASNETPGSRNEATEEDVVLTHTPIRGKVKKSHNELHEEVFGAGAPMKGLVEQRIGQPLGGYQGRSRARSGTIREDFSPRKTTMSSPSPLPPVPPLPALDQASPRITFPSGTQGLTHPEVPHDPRIDQPISGLNSRTSATDHGGSMTRSNSPKIDSSSPRRDHGHPKQSHRPRDSLVLEKVRLIDNLRTLPRPDESTDTTVPAIPQLPRSQKLDLSKFPFA